jgi:hypothetical protein
MKASGVAAFCVLAVALVSFFSLPNKDNYLFAPGFFLAYGLNEGVHGKGVLGWGNLFLLIASLFNLIIYWLMIYGAVQLWHLVARRRPTNNEYS